MLRLRWNQEKFEKERRQLVLRQVRAHLQLEIRQSELVVKARPGTKRSGLAQSLSDANGSRRDVLQPREAHHTSQR